MNIPTIKITRIDSPKAGAMIRRLRELNGISLRRLASAMNISAPFLSDLELGRRAWTGDRFHQAERVLKSLLPKKTK